ncbi:MAG: hypothetical protein WBL63_21415 [Candidatus Acidiferrum sp.]
MEIRNSYKAKQCAGRWNNFWSGDLRGSIFLFLFAAGCGAPGEPIPPSPPIPVAVTDLRARQVGDSVLLTFTVPKKSTLGERLAEMPTLEVLRGRLRLDGSPNPKSFHVVDTVPGSVLSGYAEQGKVQFPDPIQPQGTQTHPAETVVYRVRTRVSERKASPDSNDASLNLYPVPERVEELEARVTENSIQLKWAAPKRSSAGEPLPAIQEFHVYRGELAPGSVPAAERELHAAVWKLPLLQIATVKSSEYQDSGFDFGKTYAYVVRSAVNAEGVLLESSDSLPAIVTPKDTFPPAAPQDVVAAILPSAAAGTFVVDLSWAMNLENDLAGYRVYRSESESARGQLLTQDLLPTPAHRDSSVFKGRRYWYSVTAVDRAGNESAPCAAVLVEVP